MNFYFEYNHDILECISESFSTFNFLGNENIEEVYLNTHTTRETKSHTNERNIDSEVFSTASISSRSHADDNAVVSMNRGYDTDGSTASSHKSSIFILTNLITLYLLFH